MAEQAAKRGEEVFESYGDNTNNIYIKYHGFVPDENPDNCVQMRIRIGEPALKVLGREKTRAAHR